MNNKVWRLIFTILLTALAAVLGWFASNAVLNWLTGANYLRGPWVQPVYWSVFTISGVIFGVELGRTIFVRIERMADRLREMSARDKLAIGAGITLGVILTVALSIPVLLALGSNKLTGIAIILILGVILTYLCTAAAVSMKEEIRFYMPPAKTEEEPLPQEQFKILDTNVIIDGRVSDVARAGFLEGTIYVPGFVLDELQHIADSPDGLKRARGRRGLDILNQMRSELKLVVRTYDKLAAGNDEVDSRLVRLAKALKSPLVTNDFNLNKVAELQGVTVLNINELANALKPVVLPGEEMVVAIVKEGKEHTQGVGYLDDGTMIVVEGGRAVLGETVEVVVSSLLQTTAGKMIFAHLKGDEREDDFGRNVRPYTGGGARRTVRGRRE